MKSPGLCCQGLIVSNSGEVRVGGDMDTSIDKRGLGIFTVCAGLFCTATMDAVAKWLGEIYPIIQLTFFRNLFALPPILILAISTGGLRSLMPRSLWVHLGRGINGLVGLVCFFFALRYLPLASAWTIAFAGPLIVTALSPFLLKERVGFWRWLIPAASEPDSLAGDSPGRRVCDSLR